MYINGYVEWFLTNSMIDNFYNGPTNVIGSYLFFDLKNLIVGNEFIFWFNA